MSEVPRPTISRSRIEDLSDLIFGLALSIGAIELVVSTSAMTLKNAEIITAVAGFGFNFLILINVWSHYTSLASIVPIQTELMRRINMALLFLVAIEPYFFNILITSNSPSISQDVSAYYALDVGCMNLILGFFTHQLSVEDKKLISKELVQKYRISRNFTVGEGVLFLVSAIPIFWNIEIAGVQLRIILWIFSFPLSWMARYSKIFTKSTSGEQKESTDH